MTNGASPGGLPLFFVDPQPITLERHEGAGLRDLAGFSFAARTNSVPVTVAEIADVVRSYPVVFSSGPQPTMLAVLGLESDNPFVDEDGRWRVDCYIPAYVRKYPFTLLETPDGEQWILCVDESALAFEASDSGRPFYENGKATELAQQALEFCSAFQQQHRLTLEFAAELERHGLLVERVSTLKLTDGSSINLRGFRGIDEEKLAALPDEVALAWRARGWWTIVDAVLLSAINWKYLAEEAARRRFAT